MRTEEGDRLTDAGLAALSEFLKMHEGVGKRFTVRELQAFIFQRTAEAAGLNANPTLPKTAWNEEDLDDECVSLGNGQFEIIRRRANENRRHSQKTVLTDRRRPPGASEVDPYR